MPLRALLILVAIGNLACAASARIEQDSARVLPASRSVGECAGLGESGTTTAVEAEVDKLVTPLVKKDLVSGSILIARSGEVLLAKGYGLADREQGAPNTAQTPFRIASTSKAITAVAVLQLVEDGKLALDSTLESFIPGLPNGDRITVGQLLGHTSGIPSDVYLAGFREKSIESLTLDDAIDWVRENARQRFEPGARFEYSNTGYLLLSSIIEKAGGLPFEQYLATHVFGPAGMTFSGLDSEARILPGRARGYSRDEQGEVINTAYRDPSFGWGYGALYSTVLDLLIFDRALMDGRLLSEQSCGLMWAARSDTPWGNRYGMGWFIDDLDGHESATALGSTGGFMATLRHFPADSVVVVVLLNQDFGLYKELFDQISLIALGKPWKPLLEVSQTSSTTPLSALVGIYEMEDGALRAIRSSRGTLEFGDPSSATYFPVYALSESEGYVAEQNARLRFRKTDEGDTELFVVYGNLAWRGRRITGP